mgnify:CR=1 FL=1
MDYERFNDQDPYRDRGSYRLRPPAAGAKLSFFLVVLAALISVGSTVLLRLDYMELYLIAVRIPNYIFAAALLLSIPGTTRRQPFAVAATAISGYVLFRWLACIALSKLL